MVFFQLEIYWNNFLLNPDSAWCQVYQTNRPTQTHQMHPSKRFQPFQNDSFVNGFIYAESLATPKPGTTL